MALTESPLAQSMRELYSTQCLCGGRKEQRNAFCRPCWFSLPGHLQRALNRTVSDGYVLAWQEANDWLRQHRLLKPAVGAA